MDAVMQEYLIHKYSRRDGQHISSLDYGTILSNSKNSSDSNVPLLPKPPFMDNNNQPFVTLDETILLPSQANGRFLYQAINWDGDKLADIGEIPTECMTTEDNDKTRSALENREVPLRDFCLAFPVNDHSNPEEIYLVYSAIPGIAKYNLSGEKIWQHSISRTPEVDSLMIDRSNMEKSRPNHDSSLSPVRKYIAGRSSPDGDLYLVTYTNLHTPIYLRPMWIHQFDSRGMFVNRHKIVSNVMLNILADLYRKYFFFYFFNFTQEYWDLRDPNSKEHYLKIYEKNHPMIYLGEIKLPHTPIVVTTKNQLFLLENDDPDNFTVGVYEILIH